MQALVALGLRAVAMCTRILLGSNIAFIVVLLFHFAIIFNMKMYFE